jgi:hypothetical protein
MNTKQDNNLNANDINNNIDKNLAVTKVTQEEKSSESGWRTVTYSNSNNNTNAHARARTTENINNDDKNKTITEKTHKNNKITEKPQKNITTSQSNKNETNYTTYASAGTDIRSLQALLTLICPIIAKWATEPASKSHHFYQVWLANWRHNIDPDISWTILKRKLHITTLQEFHDIVITCPDPKQYKHALEYVSKTNHVQTR